MSELDGTFDKLNDKFNTSFTTSSSEIDKIEEEIQEIEDKKNELIVRSNKTDLVIKDQDYLEEEIKELIDNSKTVLQKLQNDIKIGSPARMYEVYAELLNSVLNQYKELRELNKMIESMKIMSGAGFRPSVEEKDNKISLTSDQLIDVVNKAKKNSQLNAIDASFEIEE